MSYSIKRLGVEKRAESLMLGPVFKVSHQLYREESVSNRSQVIEL